jgi:hypothetical protein
MFPGHSPRSLQVGHQRETWAEAVNSALEKAGRPERVDHRTLKAQGMDREPQPKIGVTAERYASWKSRFRRMNKKQRGKEQAEMPLVQ